MSFQVERNLYAGFEKCLFRVVTDAATPLTEDEANKLVQETNTLETRLSEATALLERAKTDVECMRTRYKEEEDRISCAVWLADLEKFNKENGK